MEIYNHQKIEKKWQGFWEEKKLYQTDLKKTKNKLYCLVMFSYPSAAKLHIGHWYNFGPTDTWARFKRMHGYNVFEPMGFDAFGLPAENYAIKCGTHPAKTTYESIDYSRLQLKAIGAMYDWDKEVITSDPEYYKWTQWVFLQLYKKGLAYRQKSYVNWCPSCQTVLANEQVINGLCERCDSEVTKKEMEQWFFKITDYAEDLLNHQGLDWPERTMTMQKNWIGKSKGTMIKFEIRNPTIRLCSGRPEHSRGAKHETNSKSQAPNSKQIPNSNDQNSKQYIEVFTTRPDTLFGVTYMVIAPEHELVTQWLPFIKNRKEVEDYIEKSRKLTEIERQSVEKEKTGVELKGITAVNPINGQKIPVWMADYVLLTYGTGIVMAVPGHDERDFEFAKKFGLPIVEVIQPEKGPIKNCLIIHGSPIYDKNKEPDFEPENGRHWIPWIKNQLERRDIKVYNPKMPVPWKPNYEDWKKVIEGMDINENSVLIGHSAGGAFAVRWLGESKKRVDKLILVVPGKIAVDDNKRLHNFYNFDVDKTIRERVNKVVIFISDNEKDYRKKSAELYRKILGGELITLRHKGHFTFRDMKTREFPELLNEILLSKAYVEGGVLVNSDKYSGSTSFKAREEITKYLTKQNLGSFKTVYRLRDWLISRQRYWGAPIPMIYCDKCGIVPVPEKDLPVKLPENVDFKPTGESPLARCQSFVNTKCPKCGGKARRETDTMDTFVCSSWYYFRYLSPHDNKSAFDKSLVKKWMPVDRYVGGAEHTNGHLIYARFMAKVLMDDRRYEPFKSLRHQGVITKAGAKMSKSRGNVVNPDEFIEKYGSDTFRMFLMFMGPYEEGGDWSDQGIVGIRRFLERVYNLLSRKAIEPNSRKADERLLHKTIKKVTEDIENLHFNTAIAILMEFLNSVSHTMTKEVSETFLKLLAPFAPHLAEELWEKLGHKDSIFKEKWPKYEEKMIKEEEIDLVIQVNGKLRDIIRVPVDISEKEVKEKALASDKIKKYVMGVPKKVIFVKKRLINFVV